MQTYSVPCVCEYCRYTFSKGFLEISGTSALGGTRPASVLVRRLQVVTFFFSFLVKFRQGGREECVADLRRWFQVGVPVLIRAKSVRGEEVVQPLATEWSQHLCCHLCRSPQVRNTGSSTAVIYRSETGWL